MPEDPESARRKPPITDETLPQWQPPASAQGAAPVVTEHTSSLSVSKNEVLGNARTQSARPVQVAVPITLAVGAIVGERYVIEQALSAGGFGAVYRASDRQITNHHVALKLLHLPAASEEARNAALRELTLIASVSHPSVVQFKDYGWHEGRLWFAMPLYQGETLDKRYAGPDGPLPISRSVARPLFERLAQGLAAMHEVGIFHHDIKPENVFVADIAGFAGGLPVLLDLGIAGKRGEGPKGLTIEYAAPETAATALGTPDKTIGAGADVFSLALVLRNLLEPETAPQRLSETIATLHQRATQTVPSLEKRELRFLKPSFARWLSLDPSERPSAAEFATELAILTQPEERREARARVLRRVIPIVLAAGLIVSLLLLQVRKQKTELTVQKEQLSQQMQQSASLRKRTVEQLEKIEAAGQQLGTQDQRLRQVISIARKLDDQLEVAEQRADGMTRSIRKAASDREALAAQQKALLTERDALIRERDALIRERDAQLSMRDGLSRERDVMRGERDAMRGERDALNAERNRLEEERNVMLTQRNDAIRERDALQSDKQPLKEQVETLTAERDALQKANDELRAAAAKVRTQALEPWK